MEEYESLIKLYPNPTQDKLFIDLISQSPLELEALKIYNLNGELVKHGKFQPAVPLSLADLKNGMYVVTGENVNGEPLFRQQIIVRK